MKQNKKETVKDPEDNKISDDTADTFDLKANGSGTTPIQLPDNPYPEVLANKAKETSESIPIDKIAEETITSGTFTSSMKTFKFTHSITLKESNFPHSHSYFPMEFTNNSDFLSEDEELDETFWCDKVFFTGENYSWEGMLDKVDFTAQPKNEIILILQTLRRYFIPQMLPLSFYSYSSLTQVGYEHDPKNVLTGSSFDILSQLYSTLVKSTNPVHLNVEHNRDRVQIERTTLYDELGEDALSNVTSALLVVSAADMALRGLNSANTEFTKSIRVKVSEEEQHSYNNKDVETMKHYKSPAVIATMISRTVLDVMGPNAIIYVNDRQSTRGQLVFQPFLGLLEDREQNNLLIIMKYLYMANGYAKDQSDIVRSELSFITKSLLMYRGDLVTISRKVKNLSTSTAGAVNAADVIDSMRTGNFTGIWSIFFSFWVSGLGQQFIMHNFTDSPDVQLAYLLLRIFIPQFCFESGHWKDSEIRRIHGAANNEILTVIVDIFIDANVVFNIRKDLFATENKFGGAKFSPYDRNSLDRITLLLTRLIRVFTSNNTPRGLAFTLPLTILKSVCSPEALIEILEDYGDAACTFGNSLMSFPPDFLYDRDVNSKELYIGYIEIGFQDVYSMFNVRRVIAEGGLVNELIQAQDDMGRILAKKNVAINIHRLSEIQNLRLLNIAVCYYQAVFADISNSLLISRASNIDRIATSHRVAKHALTHFMSIDKLDELINTINPYVSSNEVFISERIMTPQRSMDILLQYYPSLGLVDRLQSPNLSNCAGVYGEMLGGCNLANEGYMFEFTVFYGRDAKLRSLMNNETRNIFMLTNRVDSIQLNEDEFNLIRPEAHMAYIRDMAFNGPVTFRSKSKVGAELFKFTNRSDVFSATVIDKLDFTKHIQEKGIGYETRSLKKDGTMSFLKVKPFTVPLFDLIYTNSESAVNNVLLRTLRSQLFIAPTFESVQGAFFFEDEISYHEITIPIDVKQVTTNNVRECFDVTDTYTIDLLEGSVEGLLENEKTPVTEKYSVRKSLLNI